MDLENLKRLKDYYRDMTLEDVKELRRSKQLHIEGMKYTVEDCMAAVVAMLSGGGIVSSRAIKGFLDISPEAAEALYYMRDLGEGESSKILNFQYISFEKQKEVILATLGRLELHNGAIVKWIISAPTS